MNENPASSDWAAARGEKWCAQLFGMEPMLAPVDEPLIHALRLDRPCRIADIGCGGGGTTLELLRHGPAGSVVHGFDISPDLIESARARSTAHGSALSFSLADVERTSAPDEPYDRLVSRFGIMFFEDPPTAFSKLVRWLAPGGRFAFAVWGSPVENPWMTSIREAVAEVVDVPPPEPEAPGPFRYADGDKLITLLDGAGLEGLEVSDWRGALPVGGGLPAMEAAHFALAASSIGSLLANAGGEALDAARQSLAARFLRHQKGGAVRMDACVHIFTGGRRG